jgi:hypothetical protein
VRIPDPKPATLVKFHFIAMVVWAMLAIPTVLLWKQSILWIAAMSLWANFVGHFGAWDSARAEKAVDDAGGESQDSGQPM